ncbi:MAG: carbon-nitrogen hydrolase family protein [Planctomycetota bacterium]
MSRYTTVFLIGIAWSIAPWASVPTDAGDTATESSKHGWRFKAARDEIMPRHHFVSSDQSELMPQLVIGPVARPGLSGHWEKEFPIQGGKHYRFVTRCQTDDLASPRRSVVARVRWLDESRQPVNWPEPAKYGYRKGHPPRAEPEFPAIRSIVNGVVAFDDTFEAPADATRAVVELHFRWGDSGSSAAWTIPALTSVEAPAPRLVRLATVHFRPQDGQTSAEKCQQFEPLIEQAAKQQADLVVLPETLTYYRSGRSYADAAEAIPGPSTEYFGQLARKHNLYIVAGLLERSEHLVYNIAVLLGPSGNLIGKYRKVALPRGEIEGGITPGSDYPVFETRFGKLGMMICYDGFFPEVARELTNRGAEVIAWPVWGCNPMLASARACENHVYLVSSTYEDVSSDWMLSAIYGHDGQPIATATKWGTVALAEVDLNRPMRWNSLGNFKAQLSSHRPITP